MTANKAVTVIGAGGFSAEVIEAAELAGWAVAGLYDDDVTAKGRNVMGRLCLGLVRDFEQGPKAAYFLAIGTNEVRQRLSQRLTAAGHEAISIVDPRAHVSRSAMIGSGVYVGAGAFVGPQVKLGRHAIVNVGASVGHDAIIGDWSQICPGARVSGFCVLGEGAFMGSNSVLGPHGVIGEWAKLGAASFASRTVPPHALAVGVPARVVAAP